MKIIESDNLEITSENIKSNTLETSPESTLAEQEEKSFWSTEHMVINDMLYSKKEREFVTYDLTNAEYIGEFIGAVHPNWTPVCNLTANFPIEGKKIYKVDDETYVVVYDQLFNLHALTLYKEMKLNGSVLTSSKGYINIKNNIFILPMDNMYDKCPIGYDLDNAEYLGSVLEIVDKVPTEHLTSYLFPKGTKVYRFDENTIIVCYEENNKTTYIIGLRLPNANSI